MALKNLMIVGLVMCTSVLISVTAVPPPPLFVYVVTETTITLAMTAYSTSSSYEKVYKYIMLITPEGGKNTTKERIATSTILPTSYTWSGLSRSASFKIYVQACSSSTTCNTRLATAEVTTLPPKPIGISAVFKDATTVSATWSLNGDEEVDEFIIECDDDREFDGKFSSPGDRTSGSCDGVTNEPGAWYEIEVCSVFASNENCQNDKFLLINTPSVPAMVEATVRGSDVIDLMLTKGAGRVDTYKIITTPDSVERNIETADTSTTQFALNCLNASTTYKIAVFSCVFDDERIHCSDDPHPIAKTLTFTTTAGVNEPCKDGDYTGGASGLHDAHILLALLIVCVSTIVSI